MPKVKIRFPQVYWEEKEVEISQEELEKLDTEGDKFKTELIWMNLSQHEMDSVPAGESGLLGAVDVGYAKVEKVEQKATTFGGVHLSFTEPTNTADFLRKEVKEFAADMEKKLKKNDIKGGWRSTHHKDLLAFLKEEVNELEEAIKSGNPERIIEESADVANFCLMMADNAKDFIVINPPPPSQKPQ